jgi:hypothetical protein
MCANPVAAGGVETLSWDVDGAHHSRHGSSRRRCRSGCCYAGWGGC